MLTPYKHNVSYNIPVFNKGKNFQNKVFSVTKNKDK